jgi:hypothetical protein
MIENIGKLRDILEPYQTDLDFLTKDVIEGKVSKGNFKYFEACVFKVKVLYYIMEKVKTLDSQYKHLLESHISDNTLNELEFTNNDTIDENVKLYEPFYEIFEFENLLTQSKSCLDCYSKAIGSLFKESPNNLYRLIKVLKGNHLEEKYVKNLLDIINKNIVKLKGIVLDPNILKRKSLRDLSAHREKANIFFTIRKEDNECLLSDGALVNMNHNEISLLPNYLVKNISSDVWFSTLKIVEDSFALLFNDSNS